MDKGHMAIIGMTESGKSTLAMALAREYLRQRIGVIVLEPRRSIRWPCTCQTDNMDQFLDLAKRSRRCALFAEESGRFGREQAFSWLFTESRQEGHVFHYLSQYHAQVPPIARTNCLRLSLFLVGQTSAKQWAEDFGQPEIATLNAQLPLYGFVAANRLRNPPPKIVKLNLNNDYQIRTPQTLERVEKPEQRQESEQLATEHQNINERRN